MRKCVIGAVLLFVFSGCVPSVHPLYTEQDLVFDPALVGEWTDKNGKETWTFTKSGEDEYKLVYVDEEGKKGDFVVHLLRFGSRRFIDFYPVAPDLKANIFYKAHLLPVHTFMRVEQLAPLQMAMLKPDWIKKFLHKNPTAIRHERMDDTILFTAQSKELQAFLTEHENTPDAWGQCSLIRKKALKDFNSPDSPKVPAKQGKSLQKPEQELLE